LALAGAILGWAFLKSGALYLPLGLHAGWVLANESVRAMGGGNIVEDWRAWPVLLVVWGIVHWSAARQRSEPA
jgi:membrane protease YdiL (CAAX protease family)